MAHWAAVGIKCVSLHSQWFDGNGSPKTGPERGCVCTVVGVKRCLGEIYIAIETYGGFWFLASAFRPLIERTQEQDVALFAHHLAQNGIQTSSPEPVT